MLVTMDTKDASNTDKYASGFAKRLRDARGDMPQADLLRLLEEQGTSLRQARLSHYETGRNYPDPPILAMLASALGVSADWLLGLTEEPLPVVDIEEKLAAATGNHKINKIMDRLSKEKQRQLIDFGEYLVSTERDNGAADDLEAWQAAYRVMERHSGTEGTAQFLSELAAIRPDIADALRGRTTKHKFVKKG